MANRTVKDAHSIKGTNPQYLIEKIVRSRIYDSKYWKEECFALSAELLVDKAMELKYIGGVYGGNIKPAPFLCLVLKMLQIQPEKDIIVEFIKNEDFKYVRALGAMYMRLVGTSLDCYKYLEPLYNDYRKLKIMDKLGAYCVVHMDEYIDTLLREERVSDIILPRIQKRQVLEETNQLETRISALDDDLDDVPSSDEEDYKEPKRSPTPEKRGYRDLDRSRRTPSPRYRRSKSRSPHRKGRSRSPRKRDKERDRERRKSPSPIRRHRSRSKDRKHRSKSRSPPGRHHKHSEINNDRKKSHKTKRRHEKEHKDRDKERSRHGHGRSRDHFHSNSSKESLDIREANELRAKLGLAPLRP